MLLQLPKELLLVAGLLLLRSGRLLELRLLVLDLTEQREVGECEA